MSGKIFRTTLMVTLLTLVVCISVVVGMFFNFFENSYSISLANEADYLVSSVENYGIEYIENVNIGSLRISYINADGTVLYDNKVTATEMENHKDREEFIEAIENGQGESVRLSQTLSEKTYYISRRLSNGNVIRISDTRESEWAVVSRLFYQIVFVVILSVVLSAFFSKRLAKRVTKPINEIDLSNPDSTEVYEELTPLLERISQQRKQIDEQMETLRKERKEFSSITSNMTEGFIVIDKAANILSSNQAVGEILNCKDKPKEGSVFSLERSERFIKAVENALNGNHETIVLEIKGRYISVLANPVHEKHKVIGAILIFMDVTEREGRDMLRREFTANVSHELKTPLTGISLAAEMLKSGMVKTEDVNTFSERIYNEAKRLITLVEDIIKLSRLDEGEDKIAFEKCDISSIVKKATEGFDEIASKKNIEITENIDSVYLSCIPHLMEEIVYNLVSNAVKYTPAGGNITVELTEDEGNVCLFVQDTGIGIPKGEQERIFERFYRVDRSHTKAISGTGLGLSIVKHAVIIHNGVIKLDSEEGKGSKFTIVFPKG